jgi:hypothetical protein
MTCSTSPLGGANSYASRSRSAVSPSGFGYQLLKSSRSIRSLLIDSVTGPSNPSARSMVTSSGTGMLGRVIWPCRTVSS